MNYTAEDLFNNNRYNFDFYTFYQVFCLPLIKSEGGIIDKNRNTLISELFGKKTMGDSQQSQIKNGNVRIPENLKATTLKLPFNELLERFNVIFYQKSKGIPYAEKEIKFIEEYWSNLIFLICKYAEDQYIVFSSPFFEKILQAPDISNKQKVAMLFLESLKAYVESFQTDSKERKILIEKSIRLTNAIKNEYQTINQKKMPKRYYGTYRIYYFSAHYTDEVHCGLMKISRRSDDNSSARMIFGLNSTEFLNNDELIDVLNATSNNEAKEKFKAFKEHHFSYRYDKRCYLMHGDISSTDYKYYMKIDFRGTGPKINTLETMYLNLSRITDFTNKAAKYRGGLGMIVFAPHQSTPKIRVYRIGVTDEDIPIDLADGRLKQLLRLEVDDKQRISVQKDDDSAWWDYMLQVEALAENNRKQINQLDSSEANIKLN